MDFKDKPSRSTMRKGKKTDRLLNWLIGIVSLLIVIVGVSLFISLNNSPTEKSAGKKTDHENVQADKAEGKAGEESSSDANSEEQSNGSDDSSQDSTATEADDTQADDTQEQQSDSGVNSDLAPTETTADGSVPTGPWEPIGTSQEEPHQRSYDDDSQDWKEMLQALSYATGISQNDMELWWLGNGGGPELSLGRVSTHENPGTKYEVKLKWIPNEGWKPTDVSIYNGN